MGTHPKIIPVYVCVSERTSGQKCIQRGDVVGCFGCSQSLVDGSLQLFGRAPMAAFTGDAAQNRKRKKGDSGGRGVLLLSSLQNCVFQYFCSRYFICPLQSLV